MATTVFASLLATFGVTAFVCPSATDSAPFVSTNNVRRKNRFELNMVTLDDARNVFTTATTAASNSLLLSDNAEDFLRTTSSAPSSVLAGIQNVATVVVSIVFAFAGLSFLVAAFVVPAAAKQLEDETRKIRPNLWEEYEAKLGEGESMAQRPDLLQELGNIMQPLIIANNKAEARGANNVDVDSAETSNPDPRTPVEVSGDVLDVESTPVEVDEEEPSQMQQ